MPARAQKIADELEQPARRRADERATAGHGRRHPAVLAGGL